MIQYVKQGGDFGRAFIQQLKERSANSGKKVDDAVAEIVETVRRDGDAAVRMYTERFDGSVPEQLVIEKADMQELIKACDPAFVAALERAAANIRDFHARQKQQSWLQTEANGVIMGQRVRGLARVGLYVPGGTAAYPSSVLMNAIPAKIAGVKELVMVTPPGKDGKPNPDILAAALVAGVDRVFLVGGAQAVAALAFGTESIPKVDKIVGPGNIFVATAKRQLYGTVDIDMIAGPSEICIVADASGDPAFIAADMLSQAEHDKMASSILITDSKEIAEKTAKELKRQLAALDRVEIASEAIANNAAIFITEDIDSAMIIANDIAPEHLELMVEEPESYLDQVKSAGAVFLGKYAPEPLGDYVAGPNHTLPTSGAAKFASPLGVYDFLTRTSIIRYSYEDLKGVKDEIVRISDKEGLTAHGNAIKIRFGEL